MGVREDHRCQLAEPWAKSQVPAGQEHGVWMSHFPPSASVPPVGLEDNHCFPCPQWVSVPWHKAHQGALDTSLSMSAHFPPHRVPTPWSDSRESRGLGDSLGSAWDQEPVPKPYSSSAKWGSSHSAPRSELTGLRLRRSWLQEGSPGIPAVLCLPLVLFGLLLKYYVKDSRSSLDRETVALGGSPRTRDKTTQPPPPLACVGLWLPRVWPPQGIPGAVS